MEYVACNLCGCRDNRLLYRTVDTNYGFPGEFNLIECDCGLVYQNPRPDKDEMASFYPTSRYHPFKTIHGHETAIPHPTHRKRAGFLTDRMGAGKVLDVGCGSGLFLVAMQEVGWNCMGVEPNSEAAQHARDALQLDVRTGDIFLIDGEEIFDLITLWDVLEHTHSPRDVMNRAYHLLKPAGVVALHVPNWDSFERSLFRERWTAIDAPRHLYHFSPDTITLLLSQCGFEIEVLRAQAPVLTLASNVLRWGGGLTRGLLRQRQSKAGATVATNRTNLSPHRQRFIKLVHLLMQPPNSVANTLQRGASMTVIAQKGPKPDIRAARRR